MVIAYQRFNLQIMKIVVTFFMLSYSMVSNATEVGMRHEGTAQLIGSVISTPCSIAMQNRNQTIDFSPLTLTMLSTASLREQHSQPFNIELRDCGSIYSFVDSKTWAIRFDGHSDDHIRAFILGGPSQGFGVTILDNSMNALIPGQRYALANNVLQQSKSGNTFFLRYFLRLELTGKPIQAGSYQGLIRFFIDYQ